MGTFTSDTGGYEPSGDDDFTRNTPISSDKIDANFDILKGHLDSAFVSDTVIAAGAIDGSKLADATVNGSKLIAGTVPAGSLAPNSVTDTELANNAVDTAAIQDAAITVAKLDPAVIFPGGVPADSVGAVELKDSPGEITNAHIDDGALIALSKLAVDPLDRTNHTGTQLASTVSDFDTQVQTNKLDDMATPTGAVGLGSQKITNLADPGNPQDAATMNYVDTEISNAASNGRLLDTIVYSASGSFTKASYPDANKIVVKVIGGGGGGGGVTSRASSLREGLGGFGGGGGYAMREIDVSTIAASETVTIGGGGAGGNGTGPTAGATGGTSSFASGKAWQTVAVGGGGGTPMSTGFGFTSVSGGPGGAKASCIGDLVSGGNAGETATRVDDGNPPNGTSGFVIPQGTSGSGPFGGGVKAPGGTGGTGFAGDGPGAGGSGGRVVKLGGGNPTGPFSGGAGHNGLVIIEVYS